MSEKKRNLLAILRNGQNNTRETVWPGTEEKILLRPATEGDFLDASVGADSLFNGKSVTIAMQNISTYTAEISTRLLFKCIIDPDTKQLAFNSLADFRNILTPDIKTILEDELDEFCDTVSPKPENLSADEFDNLLENLKKKPVEIIGSVSSIFIARRLILTLVNQHKN